MFGLLKHQTCPDDCIFLFNKLYLIFFFFCSNKTRDNVQILEGNSASVGAACLCDSCQNDFTSSKQSYGIMLIRNMCFSQWSVSCWVTDNSTLEEGDVPPVVVVKKMRIRVLPLVVVEFHWVAGEKERGTDQAIVWCGCVREVSGTLRVFWVVASYESNPKHYGCKWKKCNL